MFLLLFGIVVPYPSISVIEPLSVSLSHALRSFLSIPSKTKDWCYILEWSEWYTGALMTSTASFC